MITGDPIEDDIRWLLQELKQVNMDIDTVMAYYNFIERGNTVSVRYNAVDVDSKFVETIQSQLNILNEARQNILFELQCLDETYLEKSLA